MKKLISEWLEGVSDIFGEYSQGDISFYMYFTLTFVEYIIVRETYSNMEYIVYTIMLIASIVNVIVCAYGIWIYQDTLYEGKFQEAYTIIFAFLAILGLSENTKHGFYIVLIPAVFTGILNVFMTLIRDARIGLLKFIILETIFMLIPFSVFVFIVSTCLNASIIVKIIIIAIYIILTPFIIAFTECFDAGHEFYGVVFIKN